MHNTSTTKFRSALSGGVVGVAGHSAEGTGGRPASVDIPVAGLTPAPRVSEDSRQMGGQEFGRLAPVRGQIIGGNSRASQGYSRATAGNLLVVVYRAEIPYCHSDPTIADGLHPELEPRRSLVRTLFHQQSRHPYRI